MYQNICGFTYTCEEGYGVAGFIWSEKESQETKLVPLVNPRLGFGLHFPPALFVCLCSSTGFGGWLLDGENSTTRQGREGR